ncbi:MAG: aminotransferase class I/II-fold pyridoxal phosphate-dependent enzyme [Acidimicrobiia bacterium]|nr:aminotransferase class I/II-fold pyridoxal phosphate-dependent enzyme [Acidimicrobiia bacterium]
MRLNPVLAALGEYPIVEIQNVARKMRDAGERLIDFSLGDPREPTPEFIRQALRDAVPEVSQYPTVAGLAVLRDAVAGYVRRRFGVEVDPATQIVPVSGAKEAIFTTPLAFIDRDRNDAGLFATPGYPIHERGIVFAGGEAIGVQLAGDFVLRAGYVPAAAWPRLRMLWTCSPHNPTGSIASLQDLRDLYAACREHGTILCSDEPYIDLYEGEPPHSALEVAGPGSPGVLAFFSCSKRSGMTGYRTGAIVGDPEAIAAIKSLRSSVGVSSPEFVQRAAAAAWADDDHVAIRREIFAAKRRVLRSKFEEDGIEVVGSEAGLYLWVKVDDDVAATKRLLAEGVVVSPGRAFGPGGEGHIRLALVPTLDECADAAEVVAACLRA